MKKILLTMACAGAMIFSASAQLLDEKNVTITMDLQPILQLNLQGPDQIDFTFDDINEYYGGITKHGANILKASASVSFDLWAAGLSENADFMWDNQVRYQAALGGAANAITELPLTALELHQFPANPSVTNAGLCGFGGAAYSADNDYSSAFAVYDPTATPPTLAGANNDIFTTPIANPYVAPADVAVGAEEKYISGGAGSAADCFVAGGSYLLEALTGGTPTDAGYYFVMDYRILPGLPVVFPSHVAANAANGGAGGSVDDVDNGVGGGTLGALGDDQYVAPGVYTMFIKYIMVEDQ